MRVIAGGYAAEAVISHWMLLCTLFLSLFLALNKRRAEISLLGAEGAKHRAILGTERRNRRCQPTLVVVLLILLSEQSALLSAATIKILQSGERAAGSGAHRLGWRLRLGVRGQHRPIRRR